MNKHNKPLSRQQNIVIQETGGETLIYDLEKNKVFCLNESSAKVWNLCNGEKSVGEIAQNLSFPEDPVWLALDQLKDEGLIQNYDGSREFFKGLKRREIIKRVGLASMVALPMVASLVAPKSVNAQSNKCSLQSPGNFSIGCACMNNLDCQSSCCSTTVCQAMRCEYDLNNPICIPTLECQCVQSPFPNGCACVSPLDCQSRCCSGGGNNPFVCQDAVACQ